MDRLETTGGQSINGPLTCKETTIDCHVYRLWQVGPQNVCSPVLMYQSSDPL